MYRTFLAVLVGVLAASAGWAVDGDSCAAPDNAATDWDSLGKGLMKPIWCVVLCDDYDTADQNCDEFDLDTVSGIPDVIAFELHENGTADCTVGSFTINTSFDQGLNPTSDNAFDLGATTSVALGGTRRLVLDARVAPPGRYILARTGATVTCTADTLDLLMIGYEEARR